MTIELAQEEDEMIQFAQEAGVEAPETVMEDIPAYETLEDGWEEAILFPPHVEPELDEDEPEVQLLKPSISNTLKGLQMLTDNATANHLDDLAPLIIKTHKQLVKL